jgi:hypothetical protein
LFVGAEIACAVEAEKGGWRVYVQLEVKELSTEWIGT